MNGPVFDLRQKRGLDLARSARIKVIVNSQWLVPSQSHSGGYVVDTDAGSCTCPDHELRGETVCCKHRWAVEFARHRIAFPDGTVVIDTVKVTYGQDWPKYNAAQCNEKDYFQVLLRSLCDGIHNPPQTGRGRPRAPLSDVIFAAAMKTFGGLSGRRSTSDLRGCAERGLLDAVPSYNTIFDYMESETPVLKNLIRISATPLAAVETSFAIDGTGFGSKVYKRWFDAKYGRQMQEATWVKLHAICGVRTNIITAAEVTNATLHDSPLLPQLVGETAEAFTMNEVSADKGYLGVKNLKAIEGHGATPYVAFKLNSKPEGPDVWRRAYHAFSFHRETWLTRYNLRQNVESTFSALKRKFGPSVRAKTPVAMTNEVYLKCLAYNISCLVHAMHELGLDPQFQTLGNDS